MIEEEINISVNGFESSSGTMKAEINEENEIEEKYATDFGAYEENCCTYTKFLGSPPPKRAKHNLNEPQALYLCLTCCPEVQKVLEKCAQICSACAHNCHENHDRVKWYTKRNLHCDCPTERIPKGKCILNPELLNGGKKNSRKRPYPGADLESFSESKQDLHENGPIKKYAKHFPHQLIGFMYRLDLSVLCLLRKLWYEDKYSSLSFEFDIFNNIILRYEDKSLYLQIEHLDQHKNSYVSYAALFAKERRIFSLNNYFDSFIRNFILQTNSLPNNIEYFLIYTNSILDLTEDRTLKQGRFRNFYPFKFDSVIGECDILKDFFFTNDSEEGRDFYQFSRDKTTRKELLKRLEFSVYVQKDLTDKKVSQDELKNQFLDKLVFAVNQPSREELNTFIKKEVREIDRKQCNYGNLQKEVLRNIAAPSEMLYEFNLLTVYMHEMFMSKKIVSINCERNSHDTSNDINIHYKNKVAYVKALSENRKIGYSQLFALRHEKNTLNKHFANFIDKSKDGIKYYIIYTDAELNIDKDNRLKKNRSKEFYPFKFDNIDIQEKKYKIFKHSFFINENSLFKFAQKKSTREKLIEVLMLPPILQKEKETGQLSDDSEKELKEKFLDSLIFAVNQPNNKLLRNFIKKEINTNTVPYNVDELREIALRWSESHELGPISIEIMENLLDDIKNNRSSDQKIEKHILEEIKFAKSVVCKEGTVVYDQLLNLLIKDERLKILKSNGINPMHVSGILSGTGAGAMRAFNDLYDMFIDEEGNKTHYIVNLEEKGINFACMSIILNGSRSNAANAFKNLYDLWFDKDGNKTKYLIRLEEEEINLSIVSSILMGSRSNAPKAFKDLYDLWFDKKGKRTQYLKSLEEEGINLATVSNILSGVRGSASKSFKDLYDVWFDEEGNKTKYLKAFEKEGIDLCTVCSILSGARGLASKAFNDLYNLWFDAEGNKTPHLRTLEENGIQLASVSNILSSSGANAAKAFKNIYDLWFDKDGNKTKYLKTMEGKEINLSNMSSILHGAGSNAAKIFKDVHDLWFDNDGNKTEYLRTLEEKGINLANITKILSGVGINAVKAFKELYSTFLDEKGSKMQYLKALEENGVNISDLCTILSGAGGKTPKALQDLYDLWFENDGNKSQYLQNLEEEGINLTNMSSILCGAGAKAPEAFKDLYTTLFDEEGNKTQFLKTLEEEEIDLNNVSSILHGSGAELPKAFTELHSTFIDEKGNKNQHFQHFTETKDGEKSFRLNNLSGILSKCGTKTRDAFEKLHNVCFDEKGERTQLLDDFYKAGFKPGNLSSLLCGTGDRAARILKRLHSVCFDDKGKQTEVLTDFFRAGFTTRNLCNLLSGSASSIEKLHQFCFVENTKEYLNHFLRDADGFTPGCLSKILHTSGANICFALRVFHDVCFNEAGDRTKVLDDFNRAGFRPRELSNLLSMSGIRAASCLRSFHNLCFGEENYLDHFLSEQDIFTPKNISKILYGAGINICSIFEKLHTLCFDKEGNKTKYLYKLIRKNPPNEISNILHQKVTIVSNNSIDYT